MNLAGLDLNFLLVYEALEPVCSALYAILVAAVALTGAGRWSFDRRQATRRLTNLKSATAVCLLLAASTVRADAPCVTAAPNRDKPFPFELISNKPYLDARVNGSRRLRFLLDTGSAVALIDRPVAQSLGFRPISEQQGFLGVGRKQTPLAPLEPQACEEIAGVRAGGLTMLSFDLSQISASEGVPVQGTIGGDFLSRFIFIIDYARKTIRVHDSGFEYKGGGVILPITIENNQIFVKALVSKPSGELIEGKFYLDTGTRGAVFFGGPFAHDNRLLDGKVVVPRATVGLGAGGESFATIFSLSELRLGSVTLHDIVATASLDERGVLADPKVAGIIGGDLLRRFLVILDYPHSRVILERTEQSAEAFGYDGSGTFLIAAGPNLDRITVLSVIPQSPADEAGLKPGDVLESVSGSPARSLEEVRRLFRREHIDYALAVRRNGALVNATLHTESLLQHATNTSVHAPRQE